MSDFKIASTIFYVLIAINNLHIAHNWGVNLYKIYFYDYMNPKLFIIHFFLRLYESQTFQ